MIKIEVKKLKNLHLVSVNGEYLSGIYEEGLDQAVKQAFLIHEAYTEVDLKSQVIFEGEILMTSIDV